MKNNVKKIRKERHLTQTRLVDLINDKMGGVTINQSQLSELENQGRGSNNLERLYSVALTLNVPLESLLVKG